MMQTQLSAPPDPIRPPADLAVAEPPRRSWQNLWLGPLLAGPVLLLLLYIFPELDQEVLHSPPAHLLIAFVEALVGVALALLVLHVARRAEDGRVFLVGMGFLASASIFITHALSTPDVLMSGRGLATSLSAQVGLLLGAIFFALSGFNINPTLNALLMRRARLWLVVYLLFYLTYNWVMLVTIPGMAAAQAREPAPAITMTAHSEQSNGSHGAADLSSSQEEPHGPAQAPAAAIPPAAQAGVRLGSKELMAFVGLACFAFALWRHYALYRHSPSRAGLGLIYGIAFFGQAMLSQYFARLYSVSFWLYHAQELIGFGVIGYAVLGAYRRGLSNQSLLESLFLTGTRARVQAGYAAAMDSLVGALSRGEQPPPALRADLRERLGLSESQVQVLEGAARAVAEERRQRRELEQLNAALRQLEDHKRQLSQMLVHDLKNPLTALVGFLEILRLDRLNTDQRTLVESALRSGRNLSDLIGDLLDVGRIEEGRMELERRLFAPRQLLDDCAEEMRGWLAQEGKIVAIEAPEDLPLLRADLRLMRRVVLNLLSNAIKHTPPGTLITLRAFCYVASPPLEEATAAPEHQIVLEVEDTGPGIPADRLDHIFEKFGRLSGESNARQDSTGLGLTFCRLVAQAHGGEIAVSSVVGQGTIFRVTLPAT
jgi:signal transduction histidine kinase